MFASLPRLATPILAFQALVVGALGYGLYHKHQSLGVCRANLAHLQEMAARIADSEAQLDKQEAALDAAAAPAPPR
ncbi:MAG TPA: hypothetical protein VK438_02030 [Xanthobacteraceae bacterium]|nr:hypothetical protein [Xanthobacteraceae bacterium]